MVGLRVMEALCNRLGMAWSQVFTIGLDACAKYLEYGVTEYLLDGGESNKSVVELTFEVMDRMGLAAEECRFLEDGLVAIHMKGIYDRYTRYRRENAIQVECLPYAQFMKQLRKSDLFVENKMIRFGDDTKRCVVLNYAVMRKKCDVEGFLHCYAAPLTGGDGE